MDGGSPRREGDRPVVFPAAGSHAQFFSQRLWLGFSAETGIGCDDTRCRPRGSSRTSFSCRRGADHRQVRVAVVRRPVGRARAGSPTPGPTGPAEKRQWDEPVGWTDGWRNGSLAVPEGNSFGTTSTDVFCNGIAAGSVALLRLLYDPWTTLIVLVCLVLLAIWLASAARSGRRSRRSRSTAPVRPG